MRNIEDQYTEKYFTDQKKYSIEQLPWLMDIVKSHIHSGDRVLDVGCGGGFFLHTLKKKYSPLYVLGVDINPIARDHAWTLGIASVERLDQAPDNSFDVIVCSQVLEHLPNPLSFLDQMKRKLKDKGKLIVVVPEEGRRKPYLPKSPDMHCYSWGEMNLGNLLYFAGFDSIQSGTYYLFLKIREDVFNKYVPSFAKKFLNKYASYLFGEVDWTYCIGVNNGH